MRSWLPALMIGLASCTALGVESAPVVSAVTLRAQIEARTAAFSRAIVEASAAGWSAESVSRIAAFYADDTIVFPPRGDPIRGAAAITAYWTRSPDRRILVHSAIADRIDVSGNLATEYGRLRTVSQVAGSDPVEGSATYVSVWRRVDGRWRKGLDTWW